MLYIGGLMYAQNVADATETIGSEASDVAGETVGAAGETAEKSLDIVGDLKDGVTDFIGDIIDFLPRLIGFVVILLIGLFVAKLVGRAVRKLLKKVKFDHYMDKAGIGAPLERAGFKDSGKFAGKLVYYTVALVVLQAAFEVLGIKAIQEPFNKLVAWIPNAIIALLLVVIGGVIANVVKELVDGVTRGQSYNNIVTKAAFFGVWVIFGLAALDQIQIGADLVDTLTTTVFTSLGAIIVIKYGVGGVWAARDRFWPAVYDSVSSKPSAARPDRSTEL